MPGGQPRLVEVVLDDQSIARATPDVEHERAVAIYDLIEDNFFAPAGHTVAPIGCGSVSSTKNFCLMCATMRARPLLPTSFR